MTSQTTFAALQAKVAAVGPCRSGGLVDRLDDVLDRARINADDTCYVEKAQPTDQWDAIALATVSDILSATPDKNVCAWFARNGVEW